VDLSMKHLNRPNIVFNDGGNPLNSFFSLSAGYELLADYIDVQLFRMRQKNVYHFKLYAARQI
jgi:hypothetical protein